MEREDRESSRIRLHGPADFEGMRKAGRLAAETLDFIAPYVVPGVTTAEIDRLCAEFIIERGAVNAPMNYRGYPKSVCTKTADASASLMQRIAPPSVPRM